MNKYQEALNDVFSKHPMSKERNLECKKLFQELVDQKKLRTEEEVLKDFEKLGYEVVVKGDMAIKLNNNSDVIEISKYSKWYSFHEEGSYLSNPIDIQEHKLLNELFQIWKWL